MHLEVLRAGSLLALGYLCMEVAVQLVLELEVPPGQATASACPVVVAAAAVEAAWTSQPMRRAPCRT